MEQQAIWAIAIFTIVYAIIIAEKLHRTVIALAGAMLMIATGIISQEAAIHHIDFNTLGLLIGMMIMVGIVATTGLFKFMAVWAAQRVEADPLKILLAFSLLTAVASALLDNVTAVLLTVPVTISITKQLNVKPTPYLLAQIIASNIGGTSTLIGDPPNIMIGSAVKELDFMAFINNLAAISFFILFIIMGLLVLLYRKDIKTTPERQAAIMQLEARKQIQQPRLLKKCLAVLALTIAAFCFHQVLHLESATVALGGAALLLLITYPNSEHHLESVFHKVEWLTIFFFVGLFVLVGALVETGVISLLAKQAVAVTAGNVTVASLLILWLSAIASAFIDNIPFVATMIPLIKEMGSMGVANLEPLWWSLSLGACLGGNGTLVGASANVVVAGLAAQEGYKITFLGFLRVGFPLMLVSIAIASVYVYVRYLW